LCHGLEELYEYCRRVAGFSELGQPLDPSILKKIKTQSAWQQELDALYNEIESWYSQAPYMTMVYAPGTKVWREWLKPHGLIHNLLAPIRRKDFERKDDVRKEVDRLSDPAVVSREVQRADRNLRERRREEITAKALGQIQARVREAVSLARRWVNLLQSNPSAQKRFVQRQVEELRRDLDVHHDKVLKELDEFVRPNHAPPIVAAVERCRMALESVRVLFDPAEPFDPEEPDPRHLIQADLLRIATLLDEQWEPHAGLSEQLVDQILDYLAKGQGTWEQSFARYAELRDHEGTERIIELLEKAPHGVPDIGSLRQRRDHALSECRHTLRQDIVRTRSEIEQAVAFGLVREEERDQYLRVVDAIELAAEQTTQFAPPHKRLQDVRAALAQKDQHALDEITQRLRESNLADDHPAQTRIRVALRDRDYFTAYEYLDMAMRGEELPAGEDRRDPLRDFLDCIPGIEEYLTNVDSHPARGGRQIVEDIRAGRSLGPVSLSRVPGAQTKQAAHMVELWFSAKRTSSIDQRGIQSILESLGFTVRNVEKGRLANRLWFDVHTQVLVDREFCAVPGYGSQAEGRYRILCVWDRPAEENLLMTVGPSKYGPPVIVFHFGRMSQQRRRDLARLCRERGQTCLVLDDTLLIFLCGERGSRLPVLFECGLPFTFQEPYTTAAGLVPPEMFYGRRREIDSIVNPFGTCFIYGGRQLGKTALLRQVESRYHDVNRGHIVLWLDLKTEGIGTARPLDAIWSLLAERFKELEIVPAQIPVTITPERLLDLVALWLEKDSQRRILLLLDEADGFLESDGEELSPNPFHRVSMLKGLMDRTNRRFKVVFAGLHDVQRTSRQVNQPLAPGHTGDPVCIGPLINHGEWREARALVERPLATIGYRFESPDLVTRILSQTNYYPNLIQLYCRYLLTSLQGPHGGPFDPRVSPPYLITSRHLEQVSRNPELRRAIRDRFDLTLNLDRRYRVIAMAIAMHSQGTGTSVATEGFPVAWIRDQVLTYWHRGFRNSSSEDALTALLDEMVGLGVLAKVSEGHYALRSPNLAVLMGTIEQIEAALLSCDSWPDPIEYNPATFRSVCRDVRGKTDPTRRSPLTAMQESQLRRRENGVTILCGCKAAGLGDVESFLEMACGKEFFTLLTRAKDESSLRAGLDKLRLREKDGVTVAVVPTESGWDLSWVRVTQEWVKRLRSKNAFVRIVFLADPRKVWQCVSVWNKEFHQILFMDGVGKQSLAPWHEASVRQWLDECDFAASAQQEFGRVMSATGGWPMVLERFLQKTSPGREDWQQRLQETTRELSAAEWKTVWHEAFGLDVLPRRDLLTGWAQWGAASIADLAQLLDAEEDEFQKVVRWADLLNLAVAVGKDQWQLDHIVSEVLGGTLSDAHCSTR
jgi:hypothetical protein